MSTNIEDVAYRLLVDAGAAGPCGSQYEPAMAAYNARRYDLVLATARGNRFWLESSAGIAIPREFLPGLAIAWRPARGRPAPAAWPMAARWFLALHPIVRMPCKHGVARTWDQDTGVLRVAGGYRYGHKQGLWRTWDRTGRLLSVERYEKGELHGAQEYYSVSGLTDVTLLYFHGAMTGRIKSAKVEK